ncbi:hypothetical protein K227x_04200 [Rubripirellula lacrimiformis]|uniref:Uncharacterized protein n=1 Tax=Rubripirellula lacrimiformis TaxID=1930273 RepID=A0A517N4J0_9BACT|nr:hypothetical protein K227x_04200 [Rubripirellula lacrimiformis]
MVFFGDVAITVVPLVYGDMDPLWILPEFLMRPFLSRKFLWPMLKL